MTTAELIPVLKAIRANPSTACVFADWFEERGDPDTARRLRTVPDWYSGWAVVERITFDSLGYDKFTANPLVKQAVIEEALGRTDPFTERDLNDLDIRLYWNTDYKLQGILIDRWHRVNSEPGWPECGAVKCRLHGPIAEVTLVPHRIRVDLNVQPLCLGSLEAFCTYWIGRHPLLNVPVVSRFCPDTVSDYQLSAIPF